MGLDAEFRAKLRWGALLHDMGKLSVPPEILNKVGRPSDEEWALLQKHPAEGARMLAPLAEWLGDAVHAAGQHHERWDGQGYPVGLRGEEISLSARIVAVADAFAVMSAARSYKRPLPMSAARAELTKNSGTQYDPAVVRAMLSASVGRVSKAAGPFASLGSSPIVAAILGAAPTIPVVVTSGAATAALTFGFAGPVAPLEWTTGTVREQSVVSVSTTSPPALALADGSAVAAEITPRGTGAADTAIDTLDMSRGLPIPAEATPLPDRATDGVASQSGFSAANVEGSPPAATTTSTDPPVSIGTPSATTSHTSTTVGAAPPSTPPTTGPPTTTPTTTPNPKKEGDPTTSAPPPETKPAPSTTSPSAETVPTTPAPADTTPPIIEITTTTVSDTKNPKGPPLASTTTTSDPKKE